MKLIYYDPVGNNTQSFDLEKVDAVRFGRARDKNQVVLRCRKDSTDPRSEEDRDFSLKISRQHLQIRLQDGRAVVVDQNAKKGTFLGDRKLATEEPHILADGDVIKISDVLYLRVEIQPGETRLIREEPERSHNLVLGKGEQQTLTNFSKSMETSRLVILFTDQVGSTRMADLVGEKQFHKIRRKRDRIQTEIIKRGGSGRTVKSTGDGLLCVFSSPQAAVERAVEIQRALSEFNASNAEEERIQMRIGLDMGQVTIERQFNFDVFGMHVNRASRVMDKAEGGQILISKNVYDAVKSWLAKSGFRPADLGGFELKGIGEPERLYRIEYDVEAPPKA